MKALLRKDRPWIVAFVVFGVMALAPATIDGGFVHTFVVTPPHRQGLFVGAWIAGLVLGVFAACFDEGLGTRELLAQRPLSARSAMRARLVGCAVVLATWFAVAPVAAYALCAFTDRGFELGHYRQWPSILAAMLPSLSACAVGLLAGSLPFVWWGRLWCLALLFLVPFSAIRWLEAGSWDAPSSLPWFVGGHLALAVAASVVAFAAARVRRDVDWPLAPATRMRIVAPLLAVCAVLMGAGCGSVAEAWLRGLHHPVYPFAVARGGRIVLVVHDRENRRANGNPLLVVDEHHVPTGERLEPAPRRSVRTPSWRHPDFLRIDPPRSQAAESCRFGAEGNLVVEADGRVLWCTLLDRRLHWIVKPDGSAFAPGSLPCGGPSFGNDAIAEPGGDGVWVFDAESATVHHVPLPDGDRVQAVVEVARRDELGRLPPGYDFLARERLVRGERGVYALRGGELVAAGALTPREEEDELRWRGRVVDPDPITWTLEFDGAEGVPPFRHTFTPHTYDERLWAAFALAPSVVRPPVLQLASALQEASGAWSFSPRGEWSRWWWLFDPLVAGGRRFWLVLASIAFAVLGALLVRRQLRLLGADAAAVRFWTIATLLLGPVAVLACAALERRRAWTDRRVPIPAPAPRIVTSEPEQHVA